MRERELMPELTGLDTEEAPGAIPRASLADLVGLAFASARHRAVFTTAVFLVGVAGSVAYYITRTPTYMVETKVLTQRPQALPSAIRSTVQDDPTRSVYELIHRRENLIALIKQTNLFSDPGGSTSRDQGLLREIPFLATLAGSARADDALNDLVRRLDRELKVSTAEGTITIAIDWPDAQQAYHLVEAALQNFLEARHLQEITAIDEVISMLQGRVVALRDELERTTEEAYRLAAREEAGAAAEEAPRPSSVRPGSEELVRLQAMIEAKERAIQDVEEFRRRRLADLQAQLDEKRGIFTDAYPSVIALRQDIEALSHESPQTARLREEHRKLREEYTARLAQQPRSPAASAALRGLRQARSSLVEQNEAVRDARFRYQQMVERLNAAQVELDTSRAAFKYRYSVVWPAQIPTKAASPNPRKVFGLGVPGSVVLAVLLAALLEKRKGRILRRWQIERGLGVPVLAELRRH